MRIEKETTTPLAEMGYEREDLNPKTIGKAAVYFFGFAVLSSILGAAFLRIPGVVPEVEAPTKPFTNTVPPPGVPVIQNDVTNITDIRDLRQKEKDFLTTTGKAEQEGFYRIPVDRALDIIASRGLPATKAETIATVPPSATGRRAPDATTPNSRPASPATAGATAPASTGSPKPKSSTPSAPMKKPAGATAPLGRSAAG